MNWTQYKDTILNMLMWKVLEIRCIYSGIISINGDQFCRLPRFYSSSLHWTLSTLCLSQFMVQNILNIRDDWFPKQWFQGCVCLLKCFHRVEFSFTIVDCFWFSDKELMSSKETLELEVASLRTSLQEQQSKMDILDNALTNAQGNVVRLEEEV